MSEPVRIWKGKWSWYPVETASCAPYIRADLVDKLKGYARHKSGCYTEEDGHPCTCGLTETLRKLEE